MSFHVIAIPDQDDLDSPVFYAGDDGREEAVAVFTTQQRAQDYIDSADWADVETVVELQPVEMLRWLLAAVENGTEILAVDPLHESQGHVPQPTLSIPELVNSLTRTIESQVHSPPPPPARSEIVAMDMLHCQKCGKVIEQRAGRPPRECCGETMTVAASSAFESFAILS